MNRITTAAYSLFERVSVTAFKEYNIKCTPKTCSIEFFIDIEVVKLSDYIRYKINIALDRIGINA